MFPVGHFYASAIPLLIIDLVRAFSAAWVFRPSAIPGP